MSIAVPDTPSKTGIISNVPPYPSIFPYARVHTLLTSIGNSPALTVAPDTIIVALSSPAEVNVDVFPSVRNEVVSSFTLISVSYNLKGPVSTSLVWTALPKL